MPKLNIKFLPSQKKLKVKVYDEDQVLKTFSLKAKKSLDGNIIVYDHHDIDIVVRPELKKITTFKKEEITGNIAYGASDRLFNYLADKGVISLESVQGGNVADSYEATILKTNVKIPIKIALLCISRWIETERPYFEYAEEYEDMQDERLTSPDAEESTELGEVPQDVQKGSIVPGYYRSPYWTSYILENQE